MTECLYTKCHWTEYILTQNAIWQHILSLNAVWQCFLSQNVILTQNVIRQNALSQNVTRRHVILKVSARQISGHEILHALTQKLGSLKTKRNRLQEEQQQLRIEFVLGHFLKKQNAFLDTKYIKIWFAIFKKVLGNWFLWSWLLPGNSL